METVKQNCGLFMQYINCRGILNIWIVFDRAIDNGFIRGIFYLKNYSIMVLFPKKGILWKLLVETREIQKININGLKYNLLLSIIQCFYKKKQFFVRQKHTTQMIKEI